MQRPVQHPMVPECAGAGSRIGTAGTGAAGTEHPARRSPGALPVRSTERSCRSPPPGARRAGRAEGGGTEVAAAAGAPPGVGEEAVGPGRRCLPGLGAVAAVAGQDALPRPAAAGRGLPAALAAGSPR